MVYASTDLLLWANFWSLFDHYSRKNIQKVTKNAFAVSCCKRLYHAKFHNSHKDTKITKRLSIPVRVTRLNQRRTLILVGVRLFIVGAYGALRIFWITKHRKIHAPFAVLVVKEYHNTVIIDVNAVHEDVDDFEGSREQVKAQVLALCAKFPLY